MLSTMQDDPLSLAQLLRYAADVHGDSTVTTWTGSDSRHQTFAELGERCARLANGLTALGVGPFDRVATFMWNNNEHMEVYCTVPAMGAVLHALNIRLFPEQLVFIAAHAEDKVVIVDGSLVTTFGELLPQLTTVRHVVVVNGDIAALPPAPGVTFHDYEQLLATQPDSFDFPVIDERSAAAMCYTSGTTGDPKGVVYSHRSLYLHALHVTTPAALGLRTGDLCLAIVPMFHVNAWSLPYAALLSGASLLMPDRFLQAEPLLAMMAAERPTYAAAVPTVWTSLLARLSTHPQDISHLREVVVGGSAAPPSLMKAFEDLHQVHVVHGWGMTETSSVGTVAHPPPGVTGDDAWPYRLSQGRFAPLVSFRLKDDESLVPSDGISLGELQVRGPWITGSYYSPDGQDPDDSHFDGGWLRTGDVGRVTPDGFLTLVDRAKDVIKSGGEWISSVEMENDVMGHPAVAEAAVFGVPDDKWDERPCVAVVLRTGATADATTLRAHLAGTWARWALPERWSFVAEVPKTSVGKFDKKELRRAYAGGELDIVDLT
ncbi:long-chain fatty acid--CoA ligase [Nocardioides aromaticivorans]|uniref:Long-chain fatty acid--CoA ligase n=1 Tax=Nocardioides aromaticivorans TaxID=200618 RepID=A0ABX7PGK8_9ACTN|nr:long-chain fatty acid--CoA ligase [Nocardioides aromaticivorans]QSR24863.1 long-chain fatty acid--CoA ligase [Nocardioides aromaticivorans]